MAKAAISVTLERDNIRWLEAHQRATGARSRSQTLDDLVSAARRGAGAGGLPRSVVGSVTIDPDDPDLTHADALVRGFYQDSLSRSPAARAAVARDRMTRRPKGRRG